SGAFFVSPTQFAGQAHSIYLLQNKTDSPILEVSESGAVRVIKPKLRDGLKIDMLIPSDQNLYGRMSDTKDGSIFEFDENNGDVLKRFDAKKGSVWYGYCLRARQQISFLQASAGQADSTIRKRGSCLRRGIAQQPGFSVTPNLCCASNGPSPEKHATSNYWICKR